MGTVPSQSKAVPIDKVSQNTAKLATECQKILHNDMRPVEVVLLNMLCQQHLDEIEFNSTRIGWSWDEKSFQSEYGKRLKRLNINVLSKGTDKASYEIQDYIKRINRNTEELASDEIQDQINRVDCNFEELSSDEIQDHIKRIGRNFEELASDEIQDHIKKIDCNPEELQKLFTENLVMDSSFVAAVKLPLNVPYREYSPYEAVPMLWEGEYLTEMEEEKEFQLLQDTSCLPRYTYHRSLVGWYIEGLPKDIIFTHCQLESCLIIIGGIITEKEKRKLFGETALSERLYVEDLQKEIEKNTAVLIVYFFDGDLMKMGEYFEKLDHMLLLKHGHVLVVMEMDSSYSKRNMTFGIPNKIEVVMKTRSMIVKNITCILEHMLSSYLVGTKKILLAHSQTHNTVSSLLEVNAILKRLKQAECYPKPLSEFAEPENNEIDNKLQRFGEKILYSVHDGNTRYIIASDLTTKTSLETLFSGPGFQNISFVITVEDKLSISELSKTGVPLHGAKFVYKDKGTDAFYTDDCFATTGSLMQANNNSLMVAVTCRHALKKEDKFYTLIDNSVVKLGQEVKQPNNKMVRLHDDISVVLIDDATRSIVDEKCEKLLIDTSKLPSPARISDRTLVKGDIVHKRGARTGLTTGIVRYVTTQQIGRFSEESRVIFITGRDSIPFAEKGDSGSLVFQHSLNPEEHRLDVLAMVQGKVIVPIPNADVICFPFIEGCKSLQQNISNIQNLDFFNH